MKLFLILLVLAVIVLILLAPFIVAAREDRKMRHAEHELIPHSDVTITRWGNS